MAGVAGDAVGVSSSPTRVALAYSRINVAVALGGLIGFAVTYVLVLWIYVGILGNGAGLVMSTLDVVAQAGGKPANFLDAGGGSKAEAITSAIPAARRVWPRATLTRRVRVYRPRPARDGASGAQPAQAIVRSDEVEVVEGSTAEPPRSRDSGRFGSTGVRA